MKTITQYREDIKNLMKKAGDIDAKCVAENRDPNSAEVSLKKEILDAVDEFRNIVEVQERQERTTELLEKPANPPLTQPKPKEGRLEGGENRDKFATRGELWMAVRNACIRGGQVDPRLRNTRTISGLGETIPSDGGFLVQTDISNAMLQEAFTTGILSSRVGTKIPISGNANSTKINGVDETSRAATRWGGIVAYWAGEGGDKTPSRPKFRQIELVLKKLIGLCYATDENLADAPQLESIITRGFNSEFGFQFDDAIVNGLGGGVPLGFLNSGCLVSVAKENGQKAKTIMAENVINMYSRMFASSLSNAVWLINQNTLPQLMMMSVAVGTGGAPVYLPPGNTLSNAPGGTLLGRPVLPIEQAASLGTLGDITFVDLQNGYVMAEKGGVQSDMSIHVRFLEDESVFRFVVRVDGQTVRATPLSPYKGGADYTQSHFIALASRA